MQNLNRKTVILVAVLLLIIGYGGGAYYFYKYRQLTKDPNAVAKQETDALVAKVGKLILLPTGEAPAVATVQDKEKLSSEPFFKNAENGDKVLIYYVAKKAYLYRPSTNQIIETAPLTTQSTNAGTTPTSTSTSTSTTTTKTDTTKTP